MHKIITMSDSAYFEYGEMFIKTRHRIDADIVLYGPDLSIEQINNLKEHNIEYKFIDSETFNNKMQYLKLPLVKEQIISDENNEYSGFSFIDFDTFFVNDWSHIFELDFDVGLTIQNDQVREKHLRSYTNGGVWFAKHSGIEFINMAEDVIINGNYDKLPEYDEIWKTLENNRPAHKTHHRSSLRWWVDQIFFSSFAIKYLSIYGRNKKIGSTPIFYLFSPKIRICFFSCSHYNVLNSNPTMERKKNVYIRHLKGRKKGGFKVKEKLSDN